MSERDDIWYEARIRELREALEPFISHHQPWLVDRETYPDDAVVTVNARVTFGQLRRAAAAMEE